ncbi:hypothetical protein ACIBIZ_09450 [Nonomuraea spiralis]|uniref:hypothetical protein n=1 Tax=Nonomuraea TaxID=83681 RepID=UPI000F78689E|nr:hypothetical protein [Nonomuraea sp. WAC 01424]RSN09317.1 hypothetical protein DMB42_18580 [Nonomuraea sp. WAC 01424]
MAHIKVGKPDVAPDVSAHVKGVRQGNDPGARRRRPGHHRDGTADARRSTGISPKKHNPILPVMPNLPPG